MGCGSSNDTRERIEIDNKIWRGKLTVHLRKATIKKDFQLIGKMDPYVKFQFGKASSQSKVCEDGGQFPEWQNETHNFTRDHQDDTVYVQLWNQNITSDDFLGEGGFALTKVRKGTQGRVDETCQLFGKNEHIGSVELSLEFELLPECQQHPEVTTPDACGQFIIQPKSASLTRNTVTFFGSMSPLVRIKLGDEAQVSGAAIDQGQNPKWEEKLIFQRESVQRDLFTVECQNFCDSGDNDLIATGFLSVTASLVFDAKVSKTVTMYYEGTEVGNLTLEAQFFPDDPSVYGQQGQQQGQPIQQQQQVQQQQPQYQQQQQQPQYQPQPVYQQPQLPQNGQGEYRFPNGDHYIGQWVNGQRSGQGQQTYRSGMIYNGQWLNDVFHGMGQLTVSGTQYNGNFVNGKKQGHGIITWTNSQQKYDGEWMENKYHGVGNWTHPNGTTQQGQFEYGNRKCWLNQTAKNFLAAGRCLQQGQWLPSDNNMYSLTFGHTGDIQVINNQTRQIHFAFNNFNKIPCAPYFLRLEMSGQLRAIDGTSQIYWESSPQPIMGQGPFKLVLKDTGNISIVDVNNQQLWGN